MLCKKLHTSGFHFVSHSCLLCSAWLLLKSLLLRLYKPFPCCVKNSHGKLSVAIFKNVSGSFGKLGLFGMNFAPWRVPSTNQLVVLFPFFLSAGHCRDPGWPASDCRTGSSLAELISDWSPVMMIHSSGVSMFWTGVQ